ncbi:MAG: capsule polysaccharide biosynthesis family protein, partial [Pseudomonadota bacterium]|nr:capsule polysaccharide biosynthesis family protein [Pseudomonadota bacterium]
MIDSDAPFDLSHAKAIGVLSVGIWRIPHLAQFFPIPVQRLRRFSLGHPTSVGCVAAWGYRPSRRAAHRYAKHHQLPLLTLEDGFIRSIGIGRAGYPPVSLIIDDMGIYFDARQPSRLEQLIQDSDDAQAGRAEACMALIRQHQLSKYNHAPVFRVTQSAPHNVLVVDQTVGDQSVAAGGASADSFQRMLQTARQQHPTSTIWIKT